MNDILSKITEIIERYNSGEFITKEKLVVLHRELSCNIYYLTKYNIEAFVRFNAIIHNSKDSVARATVKAHEEVQELRLTRKILEACKNVSIAMTNEINILKSE